MPCFTALTFCLDYPLPPCKCLFIQDSVLKLPPQKQFLHFSALEMAFSLWHSNSTLHLPVSEPPPLAFKMQLTKFWVPNLFLHPVSGDLGHTKHYVESTVSKTNQKMCKNSSISPSMTASGNLELSEKLFKQYCVGWKLGGITPLLTKVTTCSSSSRHCWEDSLSYSWSRLTWVAACFSPKKKLSKLNIHVYY